MFIYLLGGNLVQDTTVLTGPNASARVQKWINLPCEDDLVR
jgi:hypothetical protein